MRYSRAEVICKAGKMVVPTGRPSGYHDEWSNQWKKSCQPRSTLPANMAARVIYAESACTLAEALSKAGISSAEAPRLYELQKRENISAKKMVVLRHDDTGKIQRGAQARQAVGLPSDGALKLAPAAVPAGHTLFVQSTSRNRKLKAGQAVMVVCVSAMNAVYGHA